MCTLSRIIWWWCCYHQSYTEERRKWVERHSEQTQGIIFADNMIAALRKMILQPCRSTFKVPTSVGSYNEVLEMWKKYKGGWRPVCGEVGYRVRDILKFHMTDNAHIILYHSHSLATCLLLCKANGTYLNMKMEYTGPPLHNNIVAVYV